MAAEGDIMLRESYKWNDNHAAKKTILYDTSGNPHTSENPLPVAGEVTVSNPPTEYPLPADQVALEITLNSLVETLQELGQRLAPLAGAMANTAQLRVVATGAVTASGPITSAQSIAEKALAGISFPEKMAQDNLTATLANINNCIGA